MVKNSAGIHVRPSGVIKKAFESYQGRITLKANGLETELRSVLGLIALGLQTGDTVIVCVDGPDEETAFSDLVMLLEKKYDFPPRR